MNGVRRARPRRSIARPARDLIVTSDLTEHAAIRSFERELLAPILARLLDAIVRDEHAGACDEAQAEQAE